MLSDSNHFFNVNGISFETVGLSFKISIVMGTEFVNVGYFSVFLCVKFRSMG